MAQQKGANADIMLGWESAYKTVATVGFILPVNSAGVSETQAVNSPGTLAGTRNPVAPFRGNRSVGGAIVIPADSLAMPYWLKAMFGASTPTGTGPYVHEFKIGNTIPSFSLEYGFTDLGTAKYQRFLGCKAESFSMTFGGDGELTGTLNVIGASGSLEASAFDAAPTTISLARVHNFQAAITEGGSTLSNATELSINLSFGLDPSMYVIGSSGVRGTLPEGVMAISGNLKTLFEDDTLLTKANAATESSLKITITDSASSILEFEFQEVEYARKSPDIPGPQGLLVDLDFQAYYTDGSEASAAVARVTNGVASY